MSDDRSEKYSILQYQDKPELSKVYLDYHKTVGKVAKSNMEVITLRKWSKMDLSDSLIIITHTIKKRNNETGDQS